MIISVENVHGLIPKFLRRSYVVNACALLIVTRPSDGNVKPGGALGSFR